MATARYTDSMTAAEFVERRRALQLSGPELAQALGVPKSTVWRWETGKRPIPRVVSLALRALELERSAPIE